MAGARGPIAGQMWIERKVTFNQESSNSIGNAGRSLVPLKQFLSGARVHLVTCAGSLGCDRRGQS